jgi:hypothetical protein
MCAADGSFLHLTVAKPLRDHSAHIARPLIPEHNTAFGSHAVARTTLQHVTVTRASSTDELCPLLSARWIWRGKASDTTLATWRPVRLQITDSLQPKWDQLPWQGVSRPFEARSSSKWHLRIQSVPQRKHHTSPLQGATG